MVTQSQRESDMSSGSISKGKDSHIPVPAIHVAVGNQYDRAPDENMSNEDANRLSRENEAIAHDMGIYRHQRTRNYKLISMGSETPIDLLVWERFRKSEALRLIPAAQDEGVRAALQENRTMSGMTLARRLVRKFEKALFGVLDPRCPKCNIRSDTQTTACNHTTCNVCNAHFCNICYREYVDGRQATNCASSHFAGSLMDRGRNMALEQNRFKRIRMRALIEDELPAEYQRLSDEHAEDESLSSTNVQALQEELRAYYTNSIVVHLTDSHENPQYVAAGIPVGNDDSLENRLTDSERAYLRAFAERPTGQTTLTAEQMEGRAVAAQANNGGAWGNLAVAAPGVNCDCGPAAGCDGCDVCIMDGDMCGGGGDCGECGALVVAVVVAAVVVFGAFVLVAGVAGDLTGNRCGCDGYGVGHCLCGNTVGACCPRQYAACRACEHPVCGGRDGRCGDGGGAAARPVPVSAAEQARDGAHMMFHGRRPQALDFDTLRNGAPLTLHVDFPSPETMQRIQGEINRAVEQNPDSNVLDVVQNAAAPAAPVDAASDANQNRAYLFSSAEDNLERNTYAVEDLVRFPLNNSVDCPARNRVSITAVVDFPRTENYCMTKVSQEEEVYYFKHLTSGRFLKADAVTANVEQQDVAWRVERIGDGTARLQSLRRRAEFLSAIPSRIGADQYVLVDVADKEPGRWSIETLQQDAQ